MPVITVAMHPTTPEVKKALITSLTETAVKITGIPIQSFIVFIDEHNEDAIGVGGQTLKEIRRSHS
ncbi:MAG: 4-oxalocrotonate tautomerase DmpI [Pseudomonadota bacterium]